MCASIYLIYLSLWKIQMSQVTSTYVCLCLHLPLPVSLENPYKREKSLQAPTCVCDSIYLSGPCLSGKSLQMKKVLSYKHLHVSVPLLSYLSLSLWKILTNGKYPYKHTLVYYCASSYAPPPNSYHSLVSLEQY